MAKTVPFYLAIDLVRKLGYPFIESS